MPVIGWHNLFCLVAGNTWLAISQEECYVTSPFGLFYASKTNIILYWKYFGLTSLF